MNDESRIIPGGYGCGVCINYNRCRRLIGAKKVWRECDWYPIRFRLADNMEAEKQRPTNAAQK